MKRLAIALLCCASCQDLELKLAFHVPEAYRPLVSMVQVRLVTPPSPDAGLLYFDCDDIAYSRINPLQVELRQEAAWQFPADASFSLGDLRRTGSKLFLIDAFSNDGGRVVSGCEEVDALTQTSVVDVAAYPVVHATANAMQVDLGMMAQQDIVVTAKDARGLVGPVPAYYRVDTVAGRVQEGIADGGTFTVTRPPQRGPFTLLIGPRWTADSFIALPGMYAPADVPVMAGPLQSMRAGRFFGDGGAVVAGLRGDGTVVSFEGPTLSPRGVTSVDAGHLFSVREPQGPERLVAVGSSISEVRDQQPPREIGALPPGTNAIVPFDPQCSGGPAAFLINVSSPIGGAIKLMAPGGTLLDGGVGRAVAAGCVTSLSDGGTVAMLVLESSTGRSLVDFSDNTPGGFPSGRWWGVSDSTTFSTPAGGPRELVAVQQTGQLFELITVQPQIFGKALLPTVTSSLGPIDQPPLTLVAGDFDGNGQRDVAALIARESPAGGADFYVHVVLRKDPQTVIAGSVFLGQYRCGPPMLDAANLFGGPGDELVIGSCDPGQPTLRVFNFQ